MKFLAYVSGYICILVLLYSAAVYNYMTFFLIFLNAVFMLNHVLQLFKVV